MRREITVGIKDRYNEQPERLKADRIQLLLLQKYQSLIMLFSHVVTWLTVELKWTQLINTKYSVKTEAWGTFLQLQLNGGSAFSALLYHLYLEYISLELGIKNFIIISHIIKAGSV